MGMEPFANESVERLKQYCDHMGVTDRYTGYRHNLNRGSRNTTNQGYSWLSNQQDNIRSAAPPLSARPTTGHHTFREPSRHLSYSAPAAERASRPTHALSRSIQERCGINTRFPGRTEYNERYPDPSRHQDFKRGYIINPLPNFESAGRPMALHLYERSSTEYQSRFTFPDGSTLVKFPWLRK